MYLDKAQAETWAVIGLIMTWISELPRMRQVNSCQLSPPSCNRGGGGEGRIVDFFKSGNGKKKDREHSQRKGIENILKLINKSSLNKENPNPAGVWISDLNKKRFARFYFFVSTEKIYQTVKTVFDHISKHLEVRQQYSAARRIFNSLLGVWKCGQTRYFVFDKILLKLMNNSLS